MRTPKAGTGTVLTMAKSRTPGLYPLTRTLARDPAEKKVRVQETTARTQSREAARKLFPGGKAVARVRYFETQRGLTSARLPDAPIGSSAAKRTKATSGSKRPARLPYAAASAAKLRMQPKFIAALDLPVWRELGPSLIPHGQTYAKGPKSQPPVSGRCTGVDIDPMDRRHLVLCSAGGGLWA